jgi:hypothetical protein
MNKLSVNNKLIDEMDFKEDYRSYEKNNKAVVLTYVVFKDHEIPKGTKGEVSFLVEYYDDIEDNPSEEFFTLKSSAVDWYEELVEKIKTEKKQG